MKGRVLLKIMSGPQRSKKHLKGLKNPNQKGTSAKRTNKKRRKDPEAKAERKQETF